MILELENARNKAGVSRPKLSAAAAVSESTIIRIERNPGYEPGVFAAARIAKALGLSVDELIVHGGDFTESLQPSGEVPANKPNPAPTVATVAGRD